MFVLPFAAWPLTASYAARYWMLKSSLNSFYERIVDVPQAPLRWRVCVFAFPGIGSATEFAQPAAVAKAAEYPRHPMICVCSEVPFLRTAAL